MMIASASKDLQQRERGRPAASRRIERKIREDRALTLAWAIAETHPDDARQILTAALVDLSAGAPPHVPFGNVKEDAVWWAGMATPSELLEYTSAGLRELGKQALCLKMRKELFVVLWGSFPDQDQLSFVRRVSPEGKNAWGAMDE